jgi:dTDP-4-amino-4,6-dideoxygalactose transaminase
MTATHVYGNPCPVEELQAVADSAGVPLVYDAAHALGSRRAGRAIGGFGTAEVFSLSPTKVVTAAEGGLVTTDDDSLADTLRIARDYGNPGSYDCEFAGLNARLSEVHAAVGLASLSGLEERVTVRNEIAELYRAELAHVPGVAFQRVDDADTSTYKDLTLIIEPDAFGIDAAALGRALAAESIDTRHYYSPPIHQQKAYREHAGARELPITDALAARVISVPLHTDMPVGDVRRVAGAIIGIHQHASRVESA